MCALCTDGVDARQRPCKMTKIPRFAASKVSCSACMFLQRTCFCIFCKYEGTGECGAIRKVCSFTLRRREERKGGAKRFLHTLSLQAERKRGGRGAFIRGKGVLWIPILSPVYFSSVQDAPSSLPLREIRGAASADRINAVSQPSPNTVNEQKCRRRKKEI